MNIIRMSGGLERQMFQYALYMKLTAMGKEVKFDDINEYRGERAKPIMLSVFNLTYPRATWDEINQYTDGSMYPLTRIRRFFTGPKTKLYRENGYYDSKVLTFDDIYLDGSFQSEKYFDDIKEEIWEMYQFPPLDEMHLPEKSSQATREMLARIETTEAIGIHIRRSDSRVDEGLYDGICTPEYYESAIRYMQERYPDAVYYIFSNEPKWVKGFVRNLVKSQITEDMTKEQAKELRKKFVLIEANNEYTSYLDLLLLSKCRHSIISNTSFSWWGSWLIANPDKTIIAPNKWTNETDSEDVFTEGMILINAKGRVVHRVK